MRKREGEQTTKERTGGEILHKIGGEEEMAGGKIIEFLEPRLNTNGSFPLPICAASFFNP